MRRLPLLLACLMLAPATLAAGCSDEPAPAALDPTRPTTGPTMTDQQVAQSRAQCEAAAMKLPEGDTRNNALIACDDFK